MTDTYTLSHIKSAYGASIDDIYGVVSQATPSVACETNLWCWLVSQATPFKGCGLRD